ncbi:MAG: AAA family ATPase, partial [Thermosynechococcaceae cyanobacterium]
IAGRYSAAAELDSAIRHFSERSVSFSREDLYRYAFSHIQSFGIDDLDQAIAQHPSLMATQSGRFTTVEALEREIRTIRDWMADQVQPILPVEQALERLQGVGLNEGQAQAVAGVLGATDRHLIIHGLSGVGKTTALQTLKQLMETTEPTIVVQGFSPTLSAAATLKTALDIETATVESLALRPADPTPNQFWIIDEAGMVSARQMETILTKANAVGARILLVGDTKQNPSIEAGSPMRSLISHGATTFSIHEIIRQKNIIQRRAVELIAEGNPADALSLLDEHGYVEEIPDRPTRSQAIADQWLSLSEAERHATLIVTGTNTERLAINQALREGLREEGTLGADHAFTQLVNRQLTTEQKRRAENYRPGDQIRLTRDYHSTPLQKDKLYQVIAIEDKQLLVESPGGRLYWFDPVQYKDKEVFRTQEINLAEGDRLRWTATRKTEDQVNGQEFKVTAIHGTQIDIVDLQGKSRRIDGSQPLGLDYANVATAYGAQGLTAQRVIVSATNSPTSAQEPFYVKISRQVKDLQIYAEDLDQLHEWVNRSVAQANPLELIGDSYDTRTATNRPSDRQPSKRPSGDESPEPSFVRPEPGTADVAQWGDEYDSQDPARRIGELSGTVRGETGEPGTLPDRRSDSGIGWGHERSETTVDGLGTDDRRDEFPDELRRRGDSDLRQSTPQQQSNDPPEREPTSDLAPQP